MYLLQMLNAEDQMRASELLFECTMYIVYERIVFFSIFHLKCLFLLSFTMKFSSFSTFMPAPEPEMIATLFSLFVLLSLRKYRFISLILCTSGFFLRSYRSDAALDFNVSIKSDASATSPSSSVVRCNNRSIHANFVYAR